METTQAVKEKEPEETLQSAFEKLMAFRPLQANDLILKDEQAASLAKAEASKGKVVASSSGITPGMRQSILSPCREYLAKWEKARGPFEVLIHPHRGHIESLEKVGVDIQKLEQMKDVHIKQIELMADSDYAYKRAKDALEEKKTEYKVMKNKEGGREANVAANRIWYWPAILMIGVTEWLINYDTFFSFLSVPAIAAGATIILGILLAFSAHGHGTLLKQWSYRFGDHRTVADRRSEWRFFALSTFSLLLVLGAAGGARYESAIRVIVHLAESPTGVNVLGSEAHIESSPLRDILLSLLANVAAWAVGVFLAYMTHDENKDYQAKRWEYITAEKKYQKLQKKHIVELRKTEEAKAAKNIKELEATADQTKSNVGPEFAMWKAVKERDTEVRVALRGVVKHNLEIYRDALLKFEDLKVVIDGKELSTQAYQQMKIKVDDENFEIA